MEQGSGYNPESQESNDERDEIVVVEGKRYRKEYVPPYTFRTWFSHETDGFGPGPGWDFRFALHDQETAMRLYGRTFTDEEVTDPTKMPDEPYYRLEEA